MKSGEFPTTRVDWRLRAQALIAAIQADPAAAPDYVADFLADLYETGGDGECIHGDNCEECWGER